MVTFVVFSIAGLLGGVAGVMWGILFGTINATSATGVTLQVVAAVVVGGVNIFGGSGTVIGAALGALFLTFIGNALILLRLSQFWLQAVYGLVILVAVDARRRPRPTVPAVGVRGAGNDRERRRWRVARPLGGPPRHVPRRADRHRNGGLAGLPDRRNFANLISAVIEVAIMSLPMALIIIAGEIDLSVESMVGLSASILGALFAAGIPLD